MRRIVTILVGLGIVAAAAGIATAASGGLPNIGKPAMTAQPVYKGY